MRPLLDLSGLVSQIRFLWRGVLRRGEMEADMAEEFRHHIELRTEDLIREGLEPREARRRAGLEFGHIESHREAARLSRGLRFFDEIRFSGLDLKLVIRTMRRSPGFAAVSIGTLALAIGANAAIFTILHAVLLRPLPFDDPDQLVSLWFSAPGVTAEDVSASDGMYFTYRDEARAFDGVGVWLPQQVSVVGPEGPERLPAVGVTADLFPLLGVEPVIGRLFAAEDDAPGAPGTMLLSHARWLSHFGGDQSVLGRSVKVEGSPHVIVGVLPSRFALPDADAGVYLPLRLDKAEANFGGFRYRAIARLRQEASVEDAARDLERMIPLVVERYFNGISVAMLEEMGFAPAPRSLRQDYVGDIRRVLWVLGGTAGIVLLIACANLANSRSFGPRAAGGRSPCGGPSVRAAGRSPAAPFWNPSLWACWAVWSHLGWPP